MNSKINFRNNFTTGIEILEIAKVLYSQKDYEECLSFVTESLEMLDITNSNLFSDFLSLIGNILWKEFERDKAVNLWEKALIHNPENRNAELCLKILIGKNIDYTDYYPDIFEYYPNNHNTDLENHHNDENIVIKHKSRYL